MNSQIQQFILDKKCPALAEYAITFTKMERVFLSEKRSGVFNIFSSAYKILIMHFEEKASKYMVLQEEDSEEARNEIAMIAKEMDTAVSSFWEMIETAEQSIWNASRLANPEMYALNSISYVAPKLYVFYSNMINELADLYTEIETGGEEKRYAFCVNPTHGRYPRTKILFETRIEHGKVCLIYLPEENIAEIRNNQFILLHEFYHVLPSGARLRNERMLLMDELIVELISCSIGGEKSRKLVKDILQRSSFESGKETETNHLEKQEYGRMTVELSVEKWTEILQNVIVDREDIDLNWTRIIRSNRSKYNDDEWRELKQYVQSNDFEENVRSLGNEIDLYLTGGILEDVTGLLMKLFKECFADINAILLSGVSIEEYFVYLMDGIKQKISSDITNEFDTKIRCIFVCKVLERITKNSVDVSFRKQFTEEWGKDIRLHNEMKGNEFYDAIITLLEKTNITDLEDIEYEWQFFIKDDCVKERIYSYFDKCFEEWCSTQILFADRFSEYKNNFFLHGSIVAEDKKLPNDNISILEEISNTYYYNAE